MTRATTIKGCMQAYPGKIEVHNHKERTIMYLDAEHNWVVERITDGKWDGDVGERVELYRGKSSTEKLAVHIFITGIVPPIGKWNEIAYGKDKGYHINQTQNDIITRE